ncbi:hypothetical protein WJX73_005116 [Symbiochloris irregularis]|uniref:Uncharacterized protein n=1 Tax=Symbiochloris irregularis TaxID=706552 RepID=A0AAW1PZF9_9CHLO
MARTSLSQYLKDGYKKTKKGISAGSKVLLGKKKSTAPSPPASNSAPSTCVSTSPEPAKPAGRSFLGMNGSCFGNSMPDKEMVRKEVCDFPGTFSTKRTSCSGNEEEACKGTHSDKAHTGNTDYTSSSSSGKSREQEILDADPFLRQLSTYLRDTMMGTLTHADDMRQLNALIVAASTKSEVKTLIALGEAKKTAMLEKEKTAMFEKARKAKACAPTRPQTIKAIKKTQMPAKAF